jgi:protein-S-isoprenylcysteine O-methyltransferase Ste14
MTNNRYLLPVILAAATGAVLGALFTIKFTPPPLEKIIQPLWISIALYCFFSLYWTAAAKNSAPVKSSEPFSSTLLHQSLLNLALILLFFRIPGLTGRWLPESVAFTITGIAIQAAGILLAIWARRHLGKNWSAAVTAKVDHELIRTGPYQLIRHPIYTAVLAMHLGIAIASGEWHALAGVILVAIAYVRKIRLEEQTLRRVFGDQHEAYRQNSWALIPWVL